MMISNGVDRIQTDARNSQKGVIEATLESGILVSGYTADNYDEYPKGNVGFGAVDFSVNIHLACQQLNDGAALVNHYLMVYFPFLLVGISNILLFMTPFGLAVQSIREEPEAARKAVVRPARIQYLVIILSGALSGLAGAHLSSGMASGSSWSD